MPARMGLTVVVVALATTVASPASARAGGGAATEGALASAMEKPAAAAPPAAPAPAPSPPARPAPIDPSVTLTPEQPAFEKTEEPAPVPQAALPVADAALSAPTQAARPPLYKRTWFWAVVGGVVLVAAGATALALRGPPADPSCPSGYDCRK